MRNGGLVAGNWCEADGRLIREELTPLYLIPVRAAAAVHLRSAALPAALATAGIRELPAQANERALSRWDRIRQNSSERFCVQVWCWRQPRSQGLLC